MCHVMPTMIFRNIGTAHINFELCHRGSVKFRFQIHEAGHRLQYFVDCPIKRLKRERASHYHKASVVSKVSKPLALNGSSSILPRATLCQSIYMASEAGQE